MVLGQSHRSASRSQPDPGEASPMQGIMRSIERRRRSHSTTRRGRQNAAHDAAGTAAATGVMTLAPAFSQALPSLVGVRTDYTHEANRELLFSFCAARDVVRKSAE